MRVYNFSPGPAVLPEPVLQQAAAEMLDWRGSGMSVMEMSHRGRHFMGIHAQAQADLRELLAIPDDYAVLFLQGGAIAENAIVPMNLLGGRGTADYVDTGEWSRRSIEEAGRYGRVHVAASSAADGHTRVPERAQWQLSGEAAYVHICSNETIGGVQFHAVPDTGAVPLVADMSSDILSRPLDVRRFGVIYAGAQKNAGIAGLTIVIVHRQLFGRALAVTPSAFNWQVQAEHDSMLNTPPTYAIYVAGLVFRWLLDNGGVAAMQQKNQAKAALLYQYLDSTRFYGNRVHKADRSVMNVPFHLHDPALDAAFLQGAEAAGLMQLKGHRVVGGMRASLYNAMPIEGVQALVAYMKEFERVKG